MIFIQNEKEMYKIKEVIPDNSNNIRKLKRAEKLAWFFFIVIGVTYIVLTVYNQIR
ncbi:MAG: hypothetical protein HUJ25_02925 [Crocinitomicaceae bacterium]|nr:hypothetical protein [Crocinitomicaceae bacterium]